MLSPLFGLGTHREWVVVVHLHAGEKSPFVCTPGNSTWILADKTSLVAPFQENFPIVSFERQKSPPSLLIRGRFYLVAGRTTELYLPHPVCLGFCCFAAARNFRGAAIYFQSTTPTYST